MAKKKFGNLFDNVWTVPNALSALRIIIVPVFAVLFLKGETIAAVSLLFVSGLSDFFDGKIARRFNQVSELGKMLDPIADKLTQVTLAVLLFYKFYVASDRSLHAFAWVFLLFIIKEMIMLVGGGIMIAVGIRPGAAEIWGKISTFIFYGVMIAIIAVGPEIGAFIDVLNWSIPPIIMKLLVVLAVVLTFTAFASYMPATYRQVRDHHREKKSAGAEAKK